MRRLLPLLALLFVAAPAPAVLDAPIKLADIIAKLPTIFVAEVDAVDADKGTTVFLPKDDLKGKCPFPRLPVNLKDGVTAAGKKGDHTKVILDRLAKGRKLILFVGEADPEYTAWGFVEGTWFQLAGVPDKDDKQKVRWAFLNCEPALRGTFKGTSAELQALVADVIAGKAKAPAPDAKEKPGFGPTVDEEKKEKGGIGAGGPLFGVIPSTVFVAPLAVLAALFPATFGGLARGVTRWRAYLAVVSVNGLLAGGYFFAGWFQWLPNEWWASPTAASAVMLAVVGLGLLWAGGRYRKAVADDPTEADPPTHKDVLALLAFAAASLLLVSAVVVIGELWFNHRFPNPLETVPLLFALPTRELTAAVVGLLASATYLAYRMLRGKAEPEASVKTRVSGETAALVAMIVFGGVMIAVGASRSGPAAAPGAVDPNPPVTLTDGGVWFVAPTAVESSSGVTVTATHVYFGGVKDVFRKGAVVCVNRATGKQEWLFSDRELRTVYSTPVVSGDRVYVGEGLHTDPHCRLLCLDAATGEKVWEFRTTSHTEGTPAVADGKVYFSAGDDGVYCVTADGGQQVWHFAGRENGLHIDSTMTVADGRVYFGSGYQSFAAFCLDARTGEQVWKKELPLRSFGNLVVSNGKVFLGVGTGALDADLMDREPEPGRPKETVAAGAVMCLDATNKGEVLWKRDLPKSAHTQIAADEFAVYAACRDGWVHALGRESGHRLWRFDYREVLDTGLTAAAVPGANVFKAVYCVHPAGLVQGHHPLTGGLLWSKGMDPDGEYTAKVLAAPTVAVSADGKTREVFVPVTLAYRNNPLQTKAAVLRFVDANE